MYIKYCHGIDYLIYGMSCIQDPLIVIILFNHGYYIYLKNNHLSLYYYNPKRCYFSFYPWYSYICCLLKGILIYFMMNKSNYHVFSILNVFNFILRIIIIILNY